MRVIELRIWHQNDYATALVIFGLTVLDFYIVLAKERGRLFVRLGNWDGRGVEFPSAS